MKRLLLVLAAACANAPKARPAAAISSYSSRGCVEMAVTRLMALDGAGEGTHTQALGVLSNVFELAEEGPFEVGPRMPVAVNAARGSIRSARFHATWIGDPVKE